MKTISLLILPALLFCGCLTTTRYVCPDGSTVDELAECQKVNPTTTTPTLTQTDSDCVFQSADGQPDVDMMHRCQLRKTPTMGYCNQLPANGKGFDRTACVIELASVTNDTNVCSTLSGNMKTVCEAAAARDADKCAQIPVGELQEQCVRTVSAATPSPTDCTNRSGEGLVWCIIHSASNPKDCLLIDDRSYPDEALICLAGASGNLTACQAVADPVMRNLCRRVVMGL